MAEEDGDRAEPALATADDWDELLDFMTLCFCENGVTEPFEKVIPRLYRPQCVGLNAILKQGPMERIKSATLLAPYSWVVGEARLRAGGIGGVSAHPRSRGQGLMARTVGFQLDKLRTGDYDMAFLWGQRQRYQYHGFEACGATPQLTFNQHNARHAFANAAPAGLSFRPLAATDTATIRAVMALHASQPIHVDRGDDPAEFWLWLTTWGAQPHVACDGAGAVRGMLVVTGPVHAEKAEITELLAESAVVASAMVRCWLEGHSEVLKELRVALSPAAVETQRLLLEWAESCSLAPAAQTNMWWILQWESVLDALLKMRLRIAGGVGSLVQGSVTIAIEETTVTLHVDEDGARCVEGDGAAEAARQRGRHHGSAQLQHAPAHPDASPSHAAGVGGETPFVIHQVHAVAHDDDDDGDDDASQPAAAATPTRASAPTPAAVRVTRRQAMRMLFGPTRPGMVTALPPEAAALLEAWCPLPLTWAAPDGC